jgi:hypothetical protein
MKREDVILFHEMAKIGLYVHTDVTPSVIAFSNNG